ncbi:MAG TPA: OsmC family protein [Thermoplasmata archaeon]|nr:OsmC family protein [Thermoplasmata archaeon]
MKGQLKDLGDMRFRASADGGAELLFDAGDPASRQGPSPMQGALLAAMACTAADVALILRKERVRFTSLEIDADAERAEKDPRVFTRIHLHYRVRGTGVKESAVKRAIQLSAEKYCSVGVMLRRGGVEFVNTHEILPPR